MDANTDVEIPLRQSFLPLILMIGIGLPGASLFWWQGFPGCAVLLISAMAAEVLLLLRQRRWAPVALCSQGMRWWQVNRDGELIGPYWLDENTRHGGLWMTLCLRDAAKHRQYLLLGRWCVAPEAWRQLKWRVLEQAQHLRKVRVT